MAGPNSLDQAFLDRLTEIVLANLQNENFGVNELAREAGLSRYTIHRRLHEISIQNISQFIREIRLKKAIELLQNNAGHASEIAYKVGFGSPAYFNKCFHEYYGYPPGEVRKRIAPKKKNLDEQSAEDRVETSQPQPGVTTSTETGRKNNRKNVFLISVAALITITVAVLLSIVPQRHTKDKSIIILPFKNMSDDPGIQYIADGIMEDILNDLYRISDLRVISRTTSEHFRQSSLTSREIARQLNVRNVLEGSVRSYGDKTRISVQLIDAFRDNHLWSENFDRELTDIFGIQSDIALQVANKLSAVLAADEVSLIGQCSTQNPEAYDYYLRGRFLLNKANDEQRADVDRQGLITSIQYFEKAVAADNSFAEAYASMARSYLSLAGWGWMPQREGFLKSRDLSLKALSLDPDCAVAHAVLGSYYVWGERLFEEGRKEMLTSLRLDPNDAATHQAYAQLLMITGPIKEARTHMDRVLKLEPYFWVIHNLNAWIYYFEEEYGKAIEACLMARDLKPDDIITEWLFFLNYAKLGDGEEASGALKRICRLSTGSDRYDDEISNAYRDSGINGLFTWLVDFNINRPAYILGMSGQPFFISWWYAILGDREQSINWLQKNMEAGNKMFFYFNMIATIPDFDILRSDPRFLKIIDQIGLAPYNRRPAK
jgi:TolB-like protein/AraC-like DNA-binding protein